METLTVYAHEVAEVFRMYKSLKDERDDLRKKYEDAIRMFNESDLERVNLKNENAKLRECLKEAMEVYLEEVCKPSDTWFHGNLKDCATCHSKHCITKKWRIALKGVNHEND